MRRVRTRVGDRAVFTAVMGVTATLAAIAPRVRRRLEGRLPEPFDELVAGAALAAAGWATVAAAERGRPHRDDWQGTGSDVPVDLWYLAVSSPVSGLIAARLVDAMVPAHPRGSGRRGGGLRDVAATLLVTEFVHYWQHRVAHSSSLLWRAHSIHHSPNRLYWMNAVRFHPLDIFPLVVAQMVAVRLLGFDRDSVMVVQVFKGIHGQIQHANIAVDAGPLAAIVSAAPQHRVHHVDTEFGRRSNFGAVLSVFDHLFGTASPPSSTDDQLIGATGVPSGLLAQLVHPFRSGTRAEQVVR